MKAMGVLSKPGSFRASSLIKVVCVAAKREAMPKSIRAEVAIPMRKYLIPASICWPPPLLNGTRA